MNIQEARDNIGAGVIYSPRHGQREDGIITSVNDAYVFVRYSGDQHSKATSPTVLEFVVQR